MTPQDHNKTLGITHLAYGGFHLLLTTLIGVFFLFALSFPERGHDDGSVLFFIMLLIVGFSLLFTLPSLIAGYALLKRKPWARTAAIVAGVLATPSFPYGTALGVYTLWFMFGADGKAFYAHNMAGYANNMGGWTPNRYGALPGAPPVAGQWPAGQPSNKREREYVPPPQMPNWR